LSKDVDGIHFIGQHELGNKTAFFAPVTPAATIALMSVSKHGIDVKGKKVLAVGRSPIVGSPIAHMLRGQNAIVTMAHSEVCVDALERFVCDDDMVETCAGCPGLVKAEWVSGKVVINVGTTFLTASDSLHSDIEGDTASYANQYSPVPGGVQKRCTGRKGPHGL
jgi:5,10-methylene-tetrahydrofolate dehydrogenase/methenyl tetrahydrofolate cyclohydrolase